MENKRGRYAAKHFNMFKTRTVLQSGYDMYTANPPETATDDKPKPKRRQRKANAAKSGRDQRKTGQDEPKIKRVASDIRKMMLRMRKLHPTVAILAGDLEENIKKANSSDFSSVIFKAIGRAVTNMSIAKSLTQLATYLLLMKVIEILPLDNPAFNRTSYGLSS